MKKLLAGIIIFQLVYLNIQAQCNTALIISQGMPAYASSQENAAYAPGNSFDGNRTTRWSSLASDPQYLYVDLGAVTSLCQVNIIWEAAYGKDFTIDLSDDANTWNTVATITGNSSLTNNIPITGNARYVRMHGTARGTPNGYSIFGMHVYGTAPSPSCSSTNLALGATGVASSVESIAFPAYQAFDGSTGTRWSSLAADPQFIYADLGAFYNLCSITLLWESALGKDFTIDVSGDEVTWENLATVTDNASISNTFVINALGRYVRMRGTARATGYGYSLYEFQVHGYAVLPVSLIGFQASVQEKNHIKLQWKTTKETGNDHFVIERSKDGIHFSDIGTVKGYGTTSININYSWTDNFPAEGNNIYRLKQVDRDGRFTYSPEQAVHFCPSATAATFSAYPNPVTDYLTVSNPSYEHIESVSVFKATGVKIMDFKNNSNTTISIPMKTLDPGLYIIKVSTTHGIQSLKVMKSTW